jgi:penicillin-binding protein 2
MQFQETGRGRRSMPESFERVFITRRMLIAKTAIVGGFAALAGRLGYLQIVDHEQAVSAARGNTQYRKTLPAARGLIYDRKGRLLAKNETAFQVEVIPELLPSQDDQPAERRRVLDQLISELQLPDVLVVNPRAIPADQKDAVYTLIQQKRNRTGQALTEAVDAIYKAEELNYVIQLGGPLSIDEAARWRSESRHIPGLSVMNQLDYQLENTFSDSSNPIIVKTGVERETAMLIEANKLFLPGVRVDGTVLVRRYPGGASMSHILGFVGPVSEEDINENLTDGGAKIYADNDRIGKDGLEKALEKTLRGQKGVQMVLRDALGNEIGIAPGSENFNQEASSGESVSLTIDLELQSAATRALKSYIEYSNEDRRSKDNMEGKQRANSGAVVAIDPRNGDVLAMVSYPQFDNELLSQGISSALFDELTDPASGAPYFNRAIASAQPPGSTFKSFLAAAALKEGTLTPETTYVCTGGLGLPKSNNNLVDPNPHPCWNFWDGHGAMNLDEALRTSCDVFFYNTGTKDVEGLFYMDLDFDPDGNLINVGIEDPKEFNGLGIDLFHKNMVDQFWFSRRTEIILGGEPTGLMPSQEYLKDTFGGAGWTAGDTILSSIGQGMVQVTPLQMAVNTAALANHGTIYRPNLIHETIRGASESVATDGTPEPLSGEAERIPYERPEPLRKTDFKPEHLEPVRKAMYNVVNYYENPNSQLNGSVSSVQLADMTRSTELAWPRTNPPGTEEKDIIRIAGKTGTAEVAPSEEGLEELDENNKYLNQHAWFTCWAPYEEPEIVVSVLLEYGGEGGTYAAPCADTVLRAYFETTGKRSRGQKITVNGEDRLVSVLDENGEPVTDIANAPSLAFWKLGETANAAGNSD